MPSSTVFDGRLDLGAVTHFSQGWWHSRLDWLDRVGTDTIRDGMAWDLIETRRGVYEFGSWFDYLDKAEAKGVSATVLFHPENPLYNGGNTVMSQSDIEAFASFVVAALDRYPSIDRIEIGNEFNGSFVSGTVGRASIEERAVYYTNIIREVYEQVKAEHPDVMVIGGALHSVPSGYVKLLREAGAFDYMDALAFHPYRRTPEHVDQEIALMVEAMGTDAVPLFATEFGREVPDSEIDSSADYLVKMATLMGVAGVEEATWYALAQQDWFENMGLLTDEGGYLPAGRAMQIVNDRLLAHGDPEQLTFGNDPHRIYGFGDRGLVLWGPGIDATFTGENVRYWDTQGRELTGVTGIGDEVLIVTADRDLEVHLGPRRVLADSFLQFDLQNSMTGPWSYYAIEYGEYKPLEVRLGQTRNDESWNSFLTHPWLKPIYMDGISVRPVDFSSNDTKSVATVDRYTFDGDYVIDVVGTWDVSDDTTDGITVTVKLNEATIYHQVVPDLLDLRLDDIAVEAGDVLDFIVGDHIRPKGDLTDRRILIFDNDPQDVDMPTAGIPSEMVFDFAELDISSFNATRDTGEAQVSPDGSALTVTSGGWKTVFGDFDVTADTVLRLNLDAVPGGRLYAIGFENDGVGTWDTFIQLAGTVRVFDRPGNYDPALGQRHFEIAVGEYFTGSFDRMVFVAQDDVDGIEATFSDVTFGEMPVLADVNGRSVDLVSYGLRQDGNSAFVSENGQDIRVENNGWKKLVGDFDVTADTILRFDLEIEGEASLVAIGFVTDGRISKAETFKLSGSGKFGNREFAKFDADDGKVTISINVGKRFTGDYDELALIVNNDYADGAAATFSNIRFGSRWSDFTVDGAARTIESYGFRNKDRGDFFIFDDGTGLFQESRSWEQVLGDFVIDAGTRLRFSFAADIIGEAHAIMFSKGGAFDVAHGFSIAGTVDSRFNEDYETYRAGDGVVQFDIAVGEYFTGSFDRMVFITDDDLELGATSSWDDVVLI